MKWIIILLAIAAGVWYFVSNTDFNQLGSQTENTIKQEKTLKKFFSADEQNKTETREVIKEHF